MAVSAAVGSAAAAEEDFNSLLYMAGHYPKLVGMAPDGIPRSASFALLNPI